MLGRGVFLGGQPCPHPKWAGTKRSQFGGSAVFMPSPFNVERPNSAW